MICTTRSILEILEDSQIVLVKMDRACVCVVDSNEIPCNLGNLVRASERSAYLSWQHGDCFDVHAFVLELCWTNSKKHILINCMLYLDCTYLGPARCLTHHPSSAVRQLCFDFKYLCTRAARALCYVSKYEPVSYTEGVVSHAKFPETTSGG